MTTHLAPVQFQSIQGDLGQSYVFGEEAIRQELVERLSFLPFVPLVGDLVGRGSDTLRVTRYGGIGWAEAMTAMASETDPIVATGFTTGYDTGSIARYGLAKEESYQGRILTAEEALTLDELVKRVPNSWMKTLKVQACTAALSISGVVGTSGTKWTVDDEINLATNFNETEGYEGGAFTFRHPEQYTDFAESLRDEPALQTPGIFEAIQSVNSEPFDFMGFKNHKSHDVQASGSDHIGFAIVPGAIGWLRASTAPLASGDNEAVMVVPEFGLIIEKERTGKQAKQRFDANAWLGMLLSDPTVFPQFRIRSVND